MVLATASGQPLVSDQPSKLTASTLHLYGFSYDGLVDLPTASGGTIRTMQFSMTSAEADTVTLDAPAPASRLLRFTSPKLTFSGNVKLYATTLSGSLSSGPVTFTVDSPPSPSEITSEMVFTDAALDLVYASCDQLVGSSLTLSPAA